MRMSFINLFCQNNRYNERLIFIVIKVPNMSVCMSEKAGGGGVGNSELFGGLSPRGPSPWLRASHVRSVKCLLG